MKFFVAYVLALFIASAFAFIGGELDWLFDSSDETEEEAQFDKRIYYGKDAVSQFSYQVYLNNRGSSYGGCLISDTWVLTAAHCVQNAQCVKVCLGGIRKEAEVNHVVEKNNIFIHQEWSTTEIKNDIALIRIPHVKYSAYIKPVQLPKRATIQTSFEGEFIVSSGWDVTSGSNTAEIKTLQWGILKYVPIDVCVKTYGSVMTSSKICATTEYRSSNCQRDTGGPLVLAKSRVLIGFSTYGNRDTCTVGKAVAFERLSVHLDWISKTSGIRC